MGGAFAAREQVEDANQESASSWNELTVTGSPISSLAGKTSSTYGTRQPHFELRRNFCAPFASPTGVADSSVPEMGFSRSWSGSVYDRRLPLHRQNRSDLMHKAVVPKIRLVSESTVGFFVVILAFLLPSDLHNFELKNRILKWNDVYHKMPWGVIFVMSGNIAISYALVECGALQGLGSLAGGLPSNGVWAQLFFLLVTSLTSELTTVKDRVPALFALASNVSQATGLEPLSLMLPAAAASEFNFMMPSSGARNAIIFEIAYISSLEM
ncbi:hypothetical protein HPB47_024090, partial [Ixodes persulcatus]